MVAAAAGVLLDNQRVLGAEGLAEIVGHLVQVVDAGAEDGAGEAEGMLHHLVAGREPGLGQLDGGYAVAPGQAGVQRLGHGAEVVDEARGHGAGDAQRGDRLLLVQLQQLRAGGGAGQAADDGGAVEAAVHLLVLSGVL